MRNFVLFVLFLGTVVASGTGGVKVENSQFQFARQSTSSNKTTQINKVSQSHPENVTDLIESKVAQQIHNFIDHFKQDDPIGVPVPVPDPIQIPKTVQTIAAASLTMDPVFLHGISKFRIEKAALELDKVLDGSCRVTFKQLWLTGNYSLRHLLGRSSGPFHILIKDLTVEGSASLAVEKDGKLRTKSIDSDMKVTKMIGNFENLGMLKFLTSFLNSSDDRFFKTIKPYIINDSKGMIKKILDEKIEEFMDGYRVLPNSIGPVDFAIAEGRKFVREK